MSSMKKYLCKFVCFGDTVLGVIEGGEKGCKLLCGGQFVGWDDMLRLI